MARTPSTMVELGTPAPDFALPDVLSGATLTRDTIAGGRPLLVMFICAHCPYVKHVEDELGRLGRDYEGRVGIAAIQSNDIAAYPEDGPEAMRTQAHSVGFRFPYLLDESQEVARSYGAACTPDFFLFDKELRLVYRGQFDSSRPPRDGGEHVPVTGVDLRAAMDATLAGRAPSTEQRASIGCNIKWRS